MSHSGLAPSGHLKAARRQKCEVFALTTRWLSHMRTHFFFIACLQDAEHISVHLVDQNMTMWEMQIVNAATNGDGTSKPIGLSVKLMGIDVTAAAASAAAAAAACTHGLYSIVQRSNGWQLIAIQMPTKIQWWHGKLVRWMNEDMVCDFPL